MGNLSLFQRELNDGEDAFELFPGRVFRDDAAQGIEIVLGARDDAGENLTPVPHDGGRRLVARGFKTENQHARSIPLYNPPVIEFLPTRDIALAIGPVAIHWYGIMYASGFLLGIWMLPRLLRMTKIEMTPQDRETLVLWIFLGVLLGGRIGFILFYGGTYFLENPMKIIAVWEGGMSSHGGFLGVCLAVFLFATRRRIDFFRLGDVLVIPVAIGLAFGRLGNLINGELYGTATKLPWGMIFPGADGPRHPTQIYAIMKDLGIAAACYLHLARNAEKNIPSGRTGGLFLLLYGVFRFIVEIFREQPYGYTDIIGIDVSRGQLLTIPIILAGAAVLMLRRSQRP